MEFSILGPLQASDDGRPVSLQGGKPRALFSLLLLDAGTGVSTDRLIDSLWGEAPPDAVSKVLRTCVSRRAASRRPGS
jgi:DNA-binding SARP family transcriptional activator